MKGRCVICGTLGKLTRDHVPPRGTVPPLPIEIRRLTALAGGTTPSEPKTRTGYQAPTFPSLCLRCNVERLGTQYDPELIRFANGLAAWARTAYRLGLTVPDMASVSLKPAAVARAVIGHLLAAEERKDPFGELSGGTLVEAMRDYFLATSAINPAFRIFVWPYLGRDSTIARGFGLARVLGDTHGAIVGDILKFFPVAFWVVGSAPADLVFPFTELSLTIDAAMSVEISLKNVPPARWPELPGSSEVVVMNGLRTHHATAVARPSKRDAG